ncbi:hypothetical protein GBA52_026770 [Prunus armeniaca]|nr:hypothetical protein GBA52_026770 [Prunus armeniaca]
MAWGGCITWVGTSYLNNGGVVAIGWGRRVASGDGEGLGCCGGGAIRVLQIQHYVYQGKVNLGLLSKVSMMV